jgi:APA family basic amino acid/polyamine antiporter
MALGIYAVAGVASVPISFALEFPKGSQGFTLAVIICYTVCMGFQVVAEMGEEMVHAERNIPISLAIGGAIVLGLYILVGNTFVSSIPYDAQRFEAMRAPLAETGALFLSPFWVAFLQVGALSAGLTALNAAAIALPREILAQARDNVLPAMLATVNPRTRTPLNAETLYFIGVIVLILLGGRIEFYGVMAAVGILLMTIALSVAAVRLPRKYPQRYRSAYFRIPVPLLDLLAVLSILTSGVFVAIVVAQASAVVLIYAVFTGAVVLHFALRTRYLNRRGFSWADHLAQAPEFDEAE